MKTNSFFVRVVSSESETGYYLEFPGGDLFRDKRGSVVIFASYQEACLAAVTTCSDLVREEESYAI